MGFALVTSASQEGSHAVPVTVEVHITDGLPALRIVGLGDSAVLEAHERVTSALKSAGYRLPASKITVNLAPAPLKKHGTGFDVAIALGIAVASGQLSPQVVTGLLVVGELSLDGSIRAVRGSVACAVLARERGLILATHEGQRVAALAGAQLLEVNHIRDFGSGKCGVKAPTRTARDAWREKELLVEERDFEDVCGQEMAVRALTIAAAGFHPIFLVGPPGTGKTMLASRLPTLLPPLSKEEALETALVYAAYEGEERYALGTRPFRAPHHSASTLALVGGGTPVRPGEVSLAHNGVLFLDEIAQFAPSTLQALRTPMQDGKVLIVRTQTEAELPARFLLVGASNPCPCGYFGDRDHRCTCRVESLRAYQNRMGGPLIDRFDLFCFVEKAGPEALLSRSQPAPSSAVLRKKVESAYAFRKSCDLLPGSLISQSLLLSDKMLPPATRRLAVKIAETRSLSSRGLVRLLRVARSISDLDSTYTISEDALLEASAYRTDWSKIHGRTAAATD